MRALISHPWWNGAPEKDIRAFVESLETSTPSIWIFSDKGAYWLISKDRADDPAWIRQTICAPVALEKAWSNWGMIRIATEHGRRYTTEEIIDLVHSEIEFLYFKGKAPDDSATNELKRRQEIARQNEALKEETARQDEALKAEKLRQEKETLDRHTDILLNAKDDEMPNDDFRKALNFFYERNDGDKPILEALGRYADRFEKAPNDNDAQRVWLCTNTLTFKDGGGARLNALCARRVPDNAAIPLATAVRIYRKKEGTEVGGPLWILELMGPRAKAAMPLLKKVGEDQVKDPRPAPGPRGRGFAVGRDLEFEKKLVSAMVAIDQAKK
jgi:hypothetical protein